MNAKISVFVICLEAIIYLLLYNLHDSTFKCNGKYFIGVEEYEFRLAAMKTPISFIFEYLLKHLNIF